MPGIKGETLRGLRRSRGWDVPEMARQLRRAARETGQQVAAPDGLIRMIRDWERGKHDLTERYELLYGAALGIEPGDLVGSPGREQPEAPSGLPQSASADPRSLPVLSLMPRFGLDELRHVTAALDNARRYLDSDVVGYFSDLIIRLAADDGDRGPRQTLPPVLGIIAAIEHSARQVKPGVRRHLLATGARAAEFAGFLYRDIRASETAAYWRDRAIEWAQEGGQIALQGYVVLRKSQAAWDERDALRMLTLAQAAQDEIWRIPPRVRAEAAQQEARAYAMLGDNPAEMERKLGEATELMEAAPDSDDSLGAGYTRSLLAMQTAMCHSEAGHPGRAVEIYSAHLSQTAFSHRDYGYFRALMAGALAAAGASGEARQTAMQALAIARETNSARTVSELIRVARDHPDIHELQACLEPAYLP
jgi:transcriptional regulator with XRE-family HTH domain